MVNVDEDWCEVASDVSTATLRGTLLFLCLLLREIFCGALVLEIQKVRQSGFDGKSNSFGQETKGLKRGNAVGEACRGLRGGRGVKAYRQGIAREERSGIEAVFDVLA